MHQRDQSSSRVVRVSTPRLLQTLEPRQLFAGDLIASAASLQDTPQAALNASATTNGTLEDQIGLQILGTYNSGIFDESAAEIVAFDPASQRVFFTNSDSDSLGILDASDPTNPALITEIPVGGGGPNSVAVYEGLVAVAVEAEEGADPGFVSFFDTDGNLLNSLTVGVLPDMLTFTPDGQYVLTANEGEPTDEADPLGSVSIIEIDGPAESLTQAHVTTLDFTEFDGRENDLRADGVRIFPDKAASEDFEPEYLAVSPDGTQAFVALQENNAFAILDLETKSWVDVLPLGAKDFSKGLPTLEQFPITDLPDLGTTALGDTIQLGGFSGLFFDGMADNGNYKFLTVPDRGPNGDNIDGERPFLLPDYQARIVELELNTTTGEVSIVNEILLTRNDGDTNLPITGLPNIEGVDEVPVDAAGDPTAYDPFGADLEGIVRAGDDSFWMVDEYRPAIYHFDQDGVLIDRFVPEGTAAQVGDPAGTYGTESLPADYLNRRGNRGFEGMALDTDAGVLYAFIQTPLSNPDRATGNASSVIRMLGIDPTNGEPVSEYVYLLQKPANGSNVDKIGDAVYLGDGKFAVMERDSSLSETGQKFVFEVNMIGATNVLGQDFGERTLESFTPDELAEMDIQPLNKIKITNLPSLGYLPSDKPEGLAYLPGENGEFGKFAVLNDNDFALEPGAEAIALGLISFDQSNGLDASNRDDAINIQNHPVFGLYMPDAITSFEVNGQTFYISANEGDARSEDERIKDLTLDPDAFPDAEALQEDDVLGRLKVSTIDGDLDGDGDFDQLFSLGGRSFTIWDDKGNLVFDSGDDFEQITAKYRPDIFNSTNDENDPDDRSDDKGPEPEAVTTGVIDGKTYAFIGLERVGGIMMYDVSDPSAPVFVDYLNNRTTAGDAEAGTAGDLGPEDIKFVAAEDSPTGAPMLIVSNEVSGSISFYSVGTPQDDAGVQEVLKRSTTKTELRIKAQRVEKTPEEFGYFIADSPDGSVNGVQPGQAGYAYEALTSAGKQTVFADGFSRNDRAFKAANPGQSIVYYLIPEGSTQDVLELNPTNAIGEGPLTFFSVDAANPDGENHMQSRGPDRALTLKWETDLFGGDNDFNDVTIQVKSKNDAGNSNFKLQLLHASDLEGGVDAIGNAPNFAAIVDYLEDTHENTTLISAGDNYLPGPFFSASGDRSLRDSFNELYMELFPGIDPAAFNVREGGGRTDISIMNILGFDASAVGNHEFDLGTDTFEGLIEADFRGDNFRWLGAEFPYLTSNLDFSGSSDLANLFTDEILPSTAYQTNPADPFGSSQISLAPATTVDLHGKTIGVVGGTTQRVTTISSTGGVVETTSNGTDDVAALADELQPVIDALNEQTNVVILTTHLQDLNLEKELVSLLSGVDIIIGGGSDTLLADDTDTLREGDEADGDYPFLGTDADGNPVAIVSTDGEYSYVGRLVVEFDADGVLIPESIDPNVSGAFATTDDTVEDLFGWRGAAFTEGSKGDQVQKLVGGVETVVTENDGVVFGQTSVYLDGRREAVRTEETNLGNLTADANLAAAKAFDPTVVASLKNGGGIRDAIGIIDSETGDFLPTPANPDAGKEAGQISQLDINNTLRFNNGLTLLTLTAAELELVLEHAVAGSGPGSTPGQFPQVAGIHFSFDATETALVLDGNGGVVTNGDRIQSAAIVDEDGNVIDTLVAGGDLVGDPNRELRIVTLNFLAGGGDSYPFDDFGDNVLDIPEGDGTLGEQKALADFLSANFPIGGEAFFDEAETPAAFDERIQNLAERDDTVLA